jgi:type VI secretion system secreted protein Hcp
MKVLLTLFILTVCPLHAAVDMFIKIKGIDGESEDAAHKKWIDVLSFKHGNSVWKSGRQARGFPKQSGTQQRGMLTISRSVQKASPKLYLACCNGTNLPDIQVELSDKAKGSNLHYILKRPFVNNLEVARGRDGSVRETVTFSYPKIEWTYDDQKKPGRKSLFRRRS